MITQQQIDKLNSAKGVFARIREAMRMFDLDIIWGLHFTTALKKGATIEELERLI